MTNKLPLLLLLSLIVHVKCLFYHCYCFTFWQVLFISEYQDDGVPHLPVVDDPVQLLPGLVYPVPVGAVHHEYKALGAGVVMAPQRTDLILTSDILKSGK